MPEEKEKAISNEACENFQLHVQVMVRSLCVLFFSKYHEPSPVSLCVLSSFVKPSMSRELSIAVHLAFEDAWPEGC